MGIVHVILDQLYTFIALASLILLVRQVGLMRALSAIKIGKGGRKPWNTGN
jgi:hypothetical protein